MFYTIVILNPQSNSEVDFLCVYILILDLDCLNWLLGLTDNMQLHWKLNTEVPCLEPTY